MPPDPSTRSTRYLPSSTSPRRISRRMRALFSNCLGPVIQAVFSAYGTRDAEAMWSARRYLYDQGGAPGSCAVVATSVPFYSGKSRTMDVGREVPMEQQRPTKTTAKPRATARRVPGLEGLTGKLRVEVPGKTSLSFAVHDGIIEPVEQADKVDAVVAFDDDSCVEELLNGKLNPIVA